MEQHVKDGGSLVDLGKKARDLGLAIVDVIGFFEWAVDDDARRAKGLEQARHDMEMVRQLGGTRIAAPPFGATDQANLDLRKVAERYRALLELGDGFGVTPMVEVWGFSKPISRLGEAAMVAIESGHPRAAILADVYHLHKGGSDFGGLHLLGPDAIPVIHMNDYPDRPRDKLTDADRVYPGDGVAPAAGAVPGAQGDRVPRPPLARAVQSRLLEGRCPDRGQDRPGEDEGRRPRRAGVIRGPVDPASVGQPWP